jgi:predicted short-subunit dehydrogenase-like oxidoreductase (DUF2520 family)
MTNNKLSVVLIGAGNVATQTALALQAKEVSILQVFSRTEQSAHLLAEQCNCSFTTDTNTISREADIYLYAVKDDALPSLIRQINVTKGIHIHTAGSVPMSVFEGFRQNFGVFYPMQTFSKSKQVKFDNIPIFVEANSAQNLEVLSGLGKKLSNTVMPCNSEQRQALHLAAVFCCNFTNHLYKVTDDLLKQSNLPFKVMLPLIQETVDKLHYLSPAEAQTGPAVRYDSSVINKHLDALKEMPDEQALYALFTQRIHEATKK